MKTSERFDIVFADPPDNINLDYDEYDDRKPDHEYLRDMFDWLMGCMRVAPVVWWSFNAHWTVPMGKIMQSILDGPHGKFWECKPCVQVFTFGQHSNHDFGNNHRPLWRIMRKDHHKYMDAVRVQSWRQRNGDKRASPKGRVPGDVLDFQYPNHEVFERIGRWLSAALDDPNVCDEMKADINAWFETCPGDVFDFPRVTGNSKQRQDWHPTQLHVDMVIRCLKSTTSPDSNALDPFGGTGTTMRACNALGYSCTLLEKSAGYCSKLAEQFSLPILTSHQTLL